MPINDSIPGQLHREEMRAIELLAQLVPENGHIVEVGSLLGLSSWIWAKSVHDSVTVHCIDPWELAGRGGNFKLLAESSGQTISKEQFLANVSDCPNVRAHQGFSPDAFANWTQPIDLYFEDAVHVDPILARNLEFWSGHLKASGILCGHDYTERFPDVRAGVARLAERYNRRLLIINSLWLLLPYELRESTEENTSGIVRQLLDLADLYPPLDQQVVAQRNRDVSAAGGIYSFDYEIAIEDDPMEIEARLGDEIILRGSVRNVSGHDWPSALSRDCFLQVGAELQISGSLAAAARQKIMGDCFAHGQTIRFELRLLASHVGIGNCMIDLLYRQLFWFGNRGVKAKSIPTRVIPSL